MTISTLASSIQVAGNSSKTAFVFNFVGDSASDITVSSVASNGTITLLSPTTYSVSLNAAAANQIWGVGGTVIYPLSGSPLATGQSLIISRVLPYSQQITTQNQGNYYSQVTEQALDTLAMQIQQLATRTTQFRGIWLTATVYNAGDIVQDGTHGNNTSNYYICAIPNTSGTWSTDLAAGDWAISALATVPTGMLTLTGDVTGSGSSPIATTLATVNSNVGTFSNATVQVDAKGRVLAASSGSAGSGTVTSVTYTGDGVLQSSTPSSAVTTTGTVASTLLSQAANTVLAGPTSGGNTTPTFRAIAAADLPLGSSSAFGAVKVDGATITASAGVISASGAVITGTPTSVGSGTTLTLTVDFTTYSWYKLIFTNVTNVNDPMPVSASSNGGGAYTAFSFKGFQISVTTTSNITNLQGSGSGLQNAKLIIDIVQATTGGAITMFINGQPATTGSGSPISVNLTGDSALSAACNRILFDGGSQVFSSGFYTLIPIAKR